MHRGTADNPTEQRTSQGLHRKHLAGRFDHVLFMEYGNECRHDLGRRSPSAWAKLADALRIIRFAHRSSQYCYADHDALLPRR